MSGKSDYLLRLVSAMFLAVIAGAAFGGAAALVKIAIAIDVIAGIR